MVRHIQIPNTIILVKVNGIYMNWLEFLKLQSQK